MTEKQFIQKGYSIINTQTDELVNASSDESAEIITDWLNDLSNKYAEVRKENYGNIDGLAYKDEVEIPYLSERISDLECENEQLKLQYSELEIALMNNQLAYNDLKEENEYYKSKCASLEEGYLKLQRENDQLKSDLEYYRETYSIQEYGLDTETHVQLGSPILSRKELLKENEQLKQQIKIFEKFLEVNDLDIDWVEFCGVDECAFENPDFSCQECIHLKGDVE